jgi:hypothetical protein
VCGRVRACAACACDEGQQTCRVMMMKMLKDDDDDDE